MKQLIVGLALIVSASWVSVANAQTGTDSQAGQAADKHIKEVWGSGGYKNDVSGSVGFRYGFVGLEFGAIDTNNAPDNLVDAPIPHSDFTAIGERNDGSQVGGDLLGVLDLDDRFALYGGVGGYWQEKIQVVRSNVTGINWTQARGTDFEVAYSGGVHVRLSESFFIGAGYHSIRGVNGQLGVRF